ncbi:APC family permease [Sciscionella sediminilitoris]|uniref:APC family permease n=1 Tax=Sciscionella sediminilitoris TaxID=1445613 RepID=UPI0004DFA61F|nr:APC family permease [Sciscionella sp. SE31]
MTDSVSEQEPGTAKGLRAGALGLVSQIVIGVAATAPAYSIAATLGFLVIAGVGVKAPAFLVLAFIPILFIAIGFRELNRAEPDCGINFTWASRAFGPHVGWFTGWVVIIAQILVMTSQSALTGKYTLLLFGLDSLAGNRFVSAVVGLCWLAALCYLSYRGIEVSARVQWVLLFAELVVLIAFAIVALTRVGSGTAGPQSLTPDWDWFWPGGVGAGAFISATLLAVFIYWGFESCLSVNEESRNPRHGPGKAAVVSTALLVVNYLLVTVAAVAFAGVGTHGIGLGNPDNAEDVLAGLSGAVFGTGGLGALFGVLMVISVLTSSAATSQATIMPVARSTLAMASYGALPKAFARVHPRYQTPVLGTWAFGLVSAIVYIGLSLWSESVLSDSVEATGITVAIEYGMVGLSCVWVFRKTLSRSVRNLVLRGLVPGLGALFFFTVLVLAFVEYSDPGYGDTSVFGFGGVAAIAIVCLLIGVALLGWLRRARGTRGFFTSAGMARGSVDPATDAMRLEPRD